METVVQSSHLDDAQEMLSMLEILSSAFASGTLEAKDAPWDAIHLTLGQVRELMGDKSRVETSELSDAAQQALRESIRNEWAHREVIQQKSSPTAELGPTDDTAAMLENTEPFSIETPIKTSDDTAEAKTESAVSVEKASRQFFSNSRKGKRGFWSL